MESKRVSAKVRLTNRQNHQGDDGGPAALTFQPDYADGRNQEWAEATPHLSLTMTVKQDVADFFEPGAAYTLYFERDHEEQKS